jgi:hypothetical protein
VVVSAAERLEDRALAGLLRAARSRRSRPARDGGSDERLPALEQRVGALAVGLVRARFRRSTTPVFADSPMV